MVVEIVVLSSILLSIITRLNYDLSIKTSGCFKSLDLLFDISICIVQLSYHTELSQHHICTKKTLHKGTFVLVRADLVMEMGSAFS